MSKYTRKVDLVWSPEVLAVPSTQKIQIKTGSWKGETRYECTGELSVYCATNLIRNLRRALRKIRDDETAKLNNLVTEAEGSL